MERASALSIVLVLAAGTLLFLPRPVSAVPITVNDTFQYRYNGGPNTVGMSVGESVKFGAYSVIPNGTQGTTATATQGSYTQTLDFRPNTAYPNRFHSGREQGALLTGPSWTLTFTNGPDTTFALTPDLTEAPFVPLVENLSISENTLTPTFTWTVPGAFAPDFMVVGVLDHAQADPAQSTLYYAILTSIPSSFTIPYDWSLQGGHDYTFEVWLAITRDHSVSIFEPDWLSISNTFLDFSVEAAVPVPGGIFLFAPSLAALVMLRKGFGRWTR